MEAPENWPPITVAMRGQSAVLIDGWHRYEAAAQLGLEYITCKVIDTPPEGDYFRLAFELNATHGKPLTQSDRKAYASKLLSAHPEYSDREIGRRTGLHHETIGALRLQSGLPNYRVPERRPGAIESDIALLDPIRFAKATKEQKSVSGYIKRLLQSLEDPYSDSDGYSNVAGWTDDPLSIAQACFTTMGPQKASDVLELLEQEARFLLDIGKARKQIAQSYRENQ